MATTIDKKSTFSSNAVEKRPFHSDALGMPSKKKGDESPDDEARGERIRRLREQLDMNQGEFAYAVGCPRVGTVTDWEAGKQRPTQYLKAMAGLFGVNSSAMALYIDGTGPIPVLSRNGTEHCESSNTVDNMGNSETRETTVPSPKSPTAGERPNSGPVQPGISELDGMTTEQLKAKLIKISAQAMLWKIECDELREQLADAQNEGLAVLAGDKGKVPHET